MNNENLDTALTDLVDAIRGITLGSIESTVIKDAGISLIESWNDHNSDDQIDEKTELENWNSLCQKN